MSFRTLVLVTAGVMALVAVVDFDPPAAPASGLAVSNVPTASAAAATPTPAAARFESEFTSRHQAPDRAIDIHHLRLDLTVDLEAQSIAGEAALTLSPLGAARDRFYLHAAELDIESVRVSGAGLVRMGDMDQVRLEVGREVTFDHAGDRLYVDLPRAYAPDETLEVHIRYRTAPRLGLYFIAPDDAYDVPLQAWSQGEMEDNRFWFPGWDYPSDRLTSEMIVTVPAGYTAISNGELRDRRQNQDGTETWTWHEGKSHVTYLASLIVGRFAHVSRTYRSTAGHDIPLDYYVPPGMESAIERSFANTADMMRVFEEAFDHPYPWEKYAQTAIHDFRWGGMENVSATTLTANTLHDEAAHLTYQSDGLVAHELGHQWFGDLMTCKSWQEIWLNEGFATYTEVIYFEKKWGEEGLVDRLLGDRDSYFEEHDDSYRRAIVTDVYADAEDLFDSHAYSKGGLVVHMLRHVLGEEVFWRGLQRYVNEHAFQLVETAQLRRTFEEVSGRDLGRFFDQWIYHGGHPQLAARWSWDEELGQVHVHIEQVQAVDDLTPVFVTPIDLRITPAGGGAAQDLRLRLDGPSADFYLPVADRPTMVQLDPEGWLLATIDIDQPAAAWVRQLTDAREIMGRVTAARALESFAGEPAVNAALGRALREDPSRHVRGAAATTLGELGTDGALDALLTGVNDADARVRCKVAAALGSFENERAATALRAIIAGEPSPYVVADAVEALAGTKVAGVLDDLLAASRRRAHGDAIQKSAYSGMAALEDEAVIPYLEAGCSYGVPWRARAVAIKALAGVAKEMPEHRDAIRRQLVTLLDDRHFDARRTAAAALGKTGDPEALPILRQLARSAYEPGVRSRARDGVRQILAALEEEAAASPELDERIEELEKTNRQLREDLEELRQRIDG